MIFLVTFISINLIIIFLMISIIGNYRVLSSKVSDLEKSKDDLFSFDFISKIFDSYTEQPEIRTIQKKIVRNAAMTILLLLINRHLFSLIQLS